MIRVVKKIDNRCVNAMKKVKYLFYKEFDFTSEMVKVSLAKGRKISKRFYD